jgi:hypothetical protein
VSIALQRFGTMTLIQAAIEQDALIAGLDEVH